MLNSFINRFDALISFLDNRMNAILVREVRRLVRSNFITSTLIIYISILTFACLMFIGLGDSLESNGEGLFASVTAIMGFFGFLTVVAYTAGTTGMERANNDLMYITAIRPSSVVFGKFVNALVMTFLLFSVSLPFYTLAYQLRGIDFFTGFYTIWLTFLNLLLGTAFVILVFTSVKNTAQLYGAAFGILFFGFPFINLLASTFMMFTVRGRSPMSGLSIMGSSSMSGTFLLLMTISYAMIIAVFLSAAIANVSAPTSNKYMPFRITVTICFFVSLISMCCLTPSVSDALGGWSVTMIIFSLFLLLRSICESDEYSFRLRRTVPQRRLFRYLVFPFYTGRLNGVVWTTGLFAIAFPVYLLNLNSTYLASDTELFRILTLVAFAFDYTMTAVLLQRLGKKFIPYGKTWAVVACLLALFCAGGMLLYQFVYYNEANNWSDYESSLFSALNPFLEWKGLRTASAMIWFVVLAPFAFFWAAAIFRTFAPANYTRFTDEQGDGLSLDIESDQSDVDNPNLSVSCLTPLPATQTTIVEQTPIYNDSNDNDASIKNS
ncbi:MAG: hypothetical protein LBU65_02390 [Planctomycetaceae bacterium]|jgi:hypothetical protein|nr:hypothetical protein [Planctomycetaceae bacterium]